MSPAVPSKWVSAFALDAVMQDVLDKCSVNKETESKDVLHTVGPVP